MIKYIIIALVYYVLPYMFHSTSGYITLLLVINPLVCFIVSLFDSMKHGYDLSFCVIGALLFILAIFLHYNETAYIYTVIYFAVMLAAGILGGYLKGRYQSK